MNNTWMYADTAKIRVDIEYNNTNKTSGMERYIYNIKAIDLGIEERPKTNIDLEKKIIGLKLTPSNNKQPVVDIANDLKNNVLIIENRPKRKGNYTIYFDIEEIGHGATLEVVYKITVSNKSEVDTIADIPETVEGIAGTANVGEYLGKTYYTGAYDEKTKVVTTTVNKVVDYVDNNLIFRDENNEGWNIVSKDELVSEKLIDAGVQESLDANKHKQIAQTQELARELKPEGYKKEAQGVFYTQRTIDIVLTKVITGENEEDDLTYDNIAEIVQITNLVGRRDVEVIPGNQDPYNPPEEDDADYTEQIIITNPFGENRIYYALAAVVVIILIAGIVIVKKILPSRGD